MPKIRAFIAIYPDAGTVAALEKLQARLEKDVLKENVRWTSGAQMHLTLQFLGYIETVRVADFESAIASVAARHRSLEVVAEKLGCFPSRKSPRILWAGLSGEIETLQTIKTDLDAALSSLGYVPEKREFHPHLTLARITELKRKEIERLDRELVSHGTARFGEWRVERIELMQSVLSSSGAKYSVLRSFPLAAKK